MKPGIPQDGKHCLDCGKESTELCDDFYCRACHISLTFEDCLSGEWNRRMREEALSRLRKTQ